MKKLIILAALLPLVADAKPVYADPRVQGEVDDIAGITWHRSATEGATFGYGDYLKLYFGWFHKTRSFGPLRIKGVYHGSDWVFARSLLVKVDSHPVVTFVDPDPAHEVDDGVWETLDVKVENPAAFCAKVAKAQIIKVRFNGRHDYYDLELPAAQLEAMKGVCAAYVDRNSPERIRAAVQKIQDEKESVAKVDYCVDVVVAQKPEGVDIAYEEVVALCGRHRGDFVAVQKELGWSGN